MSSLSSIRHSLGSSLRNISQTLETAAQNLGHAAETAAVNLGHTAENVAEQAVHGFENTAESAVYGIEKLTKRATHSLEEKISAFESCGTILVLSSGGVIAHRVISLLLDAGYPRVRVATRHPTSDAAIEWNKKGAEIADFVWDTEDSYAHALNGVKTIFCTIPYTRGWATNFPTFLLACQRAGVRNIVKLSFYHAREGGEGKAVFKDIPLVQLHGMCDHLLAESGMNYTILGASHFMSNPMVFQGKELRRDEEYDPILYYGASASKGVNYVSPNDVAEVAVRVILDPKTHHGKEYTLTGPEAVKDKYVAEMLGHFLSKKVLYEDRSLSFFEEEEKLGGYPAWMVYDLVYLEKIKATGAEEKVGFISHDIEEICGRPAETFQEYLLAKDHMTKRELP